jgi:hypothetical protein
MGVLARRTGPASVEIAPFLSRTFTDEPRDTAFLPETWEPRKACMGRGRTEGSVPVMPG